MQLLISGCKKLFEFKRNLEKNENPLGEGESMTTCSLQYKMCIKYNHISCTNQHPDALCIKLYLGGFGRNNSSKCSSAV